MPAARNSIARPNPFLVERGVFHALAGRDEVTVDGVDRAVAGLDDGGVVVRAGIVFFRCPNHLELHTKLKAARIYCGTFQGGIRIDPNFYNTFEELDKFLALVRTHVNQGGR